MNKSLHGVSRRRRGHRLRDPDEHEVGVRHHDSPVEKEDGELLKCNPTWAVVVAQVVERLSRVPTFRLQICWAPGLFSLSINQWSVLNQVRHGGAMLNDVPKIGLAVQLETKQT